MARLTISLPEELAVAAARRASEQRRSASAYVSLLIEEDVRMHGSPAPELTELIAKLQAAYAASPRILRRVDRALRDELRQPKSAA